MNYLISIGVKKCRIESLCEIECAHEDAYLVYETFSNVLDLDFSEKRSVCLVEPKESEFETVLKMFKKNLNSSDNLIIYFSGHGELLNNSTLSLLFSDAEDSEGKYNLRRLKDELNGVEFQTILILDCCHSGAALDIANSSNIFNHEKISVLASNEPIERAQFSKEGSAFTLNLCNALNNINVKGKNISLQIIVEEIESCGNKCYINTPEIQRNVVLKEAINLIEDNKDFRKRFLLRISESDITTREMHWYYLMDFPELTKIEILNNNFDNEISEPHWLVRRAIGSLISEMRDFKFKEETVLSLLYSRNWMKQCIGLIGARKEMNQKSIKNRVIEILRSDTQIDAIWLANLYLADSGFQDIDSALSSSLSKTSWGIIDIWMRYSNKIEEDILLSKITSVVETNIMNPLIIHLYFDSNRVENEDLIEAVKKSKLIPDLYELKKRGETKFIKQKWLFSSLYGNWRDQVDLKLREFFDNTSKEEIKFDLKLAADIPLVEMRMAIFQYMIIYNDLILEYVDELKWGLQDPHPWVRRTAIHALKDHPNLIKEALLREYDDKFYPGRLDFILEAVSLGFNCDNYIERSNLNKNEMKSIKWASSNTLKGKIIVS